MRSADWLSGFAGVRADEPLAKHSQFGVGGPADWFMRVRDEATLTTLLRRCSESGVAVTVLGAGSNTLILDGGIRGLVIRLSDRGLRLVDSETVQLTAACMLPRAALDLAREGLTGLEFGIGVPGTCGASVAGNAGAFGTEVKDALLDCTALGPGGERRTFDRTECGFSYRHSRFRDDLRPWIVTSARFTVHPDDATSVLARTREVQARRKATQPIGVRSLGSVFKNPPGDAAGRLIEACGLKGLRTGGAEISKRHANFIVNAQSATAADVLSLVDRAQAAVQERFGVELEPEIVIAGEAVARPEPSALR